jgi:hypothetical protein
VAQVFGALLLCISAVASLQLGYSRLLFGRVSFHPAKEPSDSLANLCSPLFGWLIHIAASLFYYWHFSAVKQNCIYSHFRPSAMRRNA